MRYTLNINSKKSLNVPVAYMFTLLTAKHAFTMYFLRVNSITGVSQHFFYLLQKMCFIVKTWLVFVVDNLIQFRGILTLVFFYTFNTIYYVFKNK